MKILMNIKKIFSPKIYSTINILKQKKYKILKIGSLKIRIYSKNYYKIEFPWHEDFYDYFSSNDMEEKINNLKQDMDQISCEYIDKFIELSKFWNKNYKNPWTKYDILLHQEEQALNFKQPCANIIQINPFLISNKYGLKDLPEEIYNSINGKNIIDGGGYNGDTAYMFSKYFPDSKIYVFEPLSVNISKINNVSKECSLNNVIPVQKALGEKEEQIEITFNDTELADVTTIDSFFADKNVGLIKLDTEGFETNIINGAQKTIKEQKPVLAIAIYHRAADFFDIKDKLKKLNPDYRFMIRRSEQIISTADLVLIAY